MNNREQKTVNTITDNMNTCGFSQKEFCELMGREHRYLQNDFTSLCVRWLEYAAQQYKNGDYDGRNEFGCKTAKILIEHYYNM